MSAFKRRTNQSGTTYVGVRAIDGHNRRRVFCGWLLATHTPISVVARGIVDWTIALTHRTQ